MHSIETHHMNVIQMRTTVVQVVNESDRITESLFVGTCLQRETWRESGEKRGESGEKRGESGEKRRERA